MLLAFRKLALSSELDVLRALGLSYGRLLRIPYLFALTLALANLAIVWKVQPYSRYAYEGLRFELRSGALGASIKVGEFTKLAHDMTLRVEQSRNQGRDLSGIFVRTVGKDGKTLAVVAERGTFLATDDPDTIILRLANGTLVHDAPGFPAPRVLSFAGHDLPIDLPKEGTFRQRGDHDRELTIPELVKVAATGPHDRSRAQVRAELHFRLVEVATMFVLPLLAVALAVPPKRSTSALGVFLSIVMIVTEYKINEYCEGLGGRGKVDPVIALWGPFLLFAALCWWMYRTLAVVPGGQPIGALERVAAKAGKAIRRWLPFLRAPGSSAAAVGAPGA